MQPPSAQENSPACKRSDSVRVQTGRKARWRDERVISVSPAYNLLVRFGLMLLIAAVCAGGDRNPDQALAQLREIVLGQAGRVPNYTCVQIIERTYFRPQGTKPGHPGPCDEIQAMKAKKAYRLAPYLADRFRVDVRVGPHSEMYSWAGASRFGDRPLLELLGRGPSSTGVFAPLLINTVRDAPEFKFEDEKKIDGRRAYAYSFRVPVERSHYDFMELGGSSVTIAYRGAIVADAETGAPVQLSIVEDELPPETNACRVIGTIDYSRVRVGASEFLLPSKASERFVTPGGAETQYTVTFGSCREYKAEANIAFRDAPPPAPVKQAAPASPPAPEIPAGLPVSIVLAGEIDSKAAAAGDPFTGRLAAPVQDKGGTVFAPKGAIVHGRVSAVEHLFSPKEYVGIQLRIETIEIGGRTVPFHLAPPSPLRPPTAAVLSSRGIAIGELPGLLQIIREGAGAVPCHLGKRCVLHKGVQTEWVTAAQP